MDTMPMAYRIFRILCPKSNLRSFNVLFFLNRGSMDNRDNGVSLTRKFVPCNYKQFL